MNFKYQCFKRIWDELILMQTRLWKYMRGGVRAAELYWTFVIRLSVKLQSSLKYVCKMNKEWNLVSFTQNTHRDSPQSAHVRAAGVTRYWE